MIYKIRIAESVETCIEKIPDTAKILLMNNRQIGILITNVGTPDKPDEESVREYLAEFLSDQNVIDYPRWFWLPILNRIILKRRPERSARLYQKIWLPDGSPLLLAMNQIANKLHASLNRSTDSPHGGPGILDEDSNNSSFSGNYHVAIGMRYGNPSLSDAIDSLLAKNIDELVVLPLYPQDSITTTGTTLDAVHQVLDSYGSNANIRVIKDYYKHPDYITAIAQGIREDWKTHGKTDRLLFSFHGVPLRYQKFDRYYDACHETARLVAEELALEEDSWQVSFQSRFGPEPWLQPYTDETLRKWGRTGVRSVGVIAPGFAVDCLETIDELGREAKEDFIGAGGEEFRYIPSLNDGDLQIDLIKTLILETAETFNQSHCL